MANLIRRDPFDEMVSWNRAMNRMFDRFYGDDEAGFGDRFNLHMPLDVIENDNEFVVKADIAGINPGEVKSPTQQHPDPQGRGKGRTGGRP